jgi:hypothetical protein
MIINKNKIIVISNLNETNIMPYFNKKNYGNSLYIALNIIFDYVNM